MCLEKLRGIFNFVPVGKEKQYIAAFGKNLRKIREEHNLTQEHLAIDSNIPTNQIGRIERGEINTSIGTLYGISKALDLEIKNLFEF